MNHRLDPAAWLDRTGVRELLAALDPDQADVRLVGGAVRDLLLGLVPGDLDLATSLPPSAVIARAEAARIKAVPTGIDHGTVTLVSRGTVIEVTTLRADIATDGRRATVEYTDDWRADAARRDFTFNALYADPYNGQLTDYFGGQADLAAGRVRFIGEPLQRIAEDHLRILRFFRFQARFGHGEPDPAALAACAARANDLMALSRERIADELLKLLAVADPAPTVGIMLDQRILAPVLPELVADAVARLTALAEAERAAGIAPAALRRLASALPRDPAVAERIAARLKFSNAARKRLALAADADLAAGPHALAYTIGLASAEDRLLLAGRPDQAAALANWPIPRLPIGGGDLIARGVVQGPLVAHTLQAIERAWIAADFPTGAAFEAVVRAVLDHDRFR